MRTIQQLAQVPTEEQKEHYDRLIALSTIIEQSDASPLSKQNALLLVETFKFILLNQQLIIRRFNGDESVYQNEHDRKNGLLRDHNGTSFHLNSYSSAEEAISSLLKMLDNLIGAYEQAKTLNALTVFIEKFEYDHNVGCLEARMSRPLMYIVTLTSTGVEDINDIMQKALAATPENTDFFFYITNLKKNIFPYIGTTVSIANETTPKKLSWNLVKDQLLIILSIEKGTKDHFLLNQLFSPIEIYFDYLKNFIVEIKFEKYDMIEHCFYQKSDAEEFISYIKKLPFFLNNYRIEREQIIQKNKQYTIRLSQFYINKIAMHSHISSRLLLQWCNGKTNAFPQLFSSNAERIACGALFEPYYAKTITGFKSSGAWPTTINSMTLRDRTDKPILRKIKPGVSKPFRVRLNTYIREHETHCVGDSSQSLHKEEKKRRELAKEIPLPPHQSFTYYDPTDSNFIVTFFSPSSLSDQKKKEIIGFRVKVEGSFLNRLLVNDQGTFNVFYGFENEESAKKFQENIRTTKRWALSHDELKKLQRKSTYNEAMLRANWCCDGSSQIFIYPPLDSLSGRYLAILYKMDLEQHLKNHQEIYKNAPIGWYEGYQVPLAYWDERKPAFYSSIEQEIDLEKECDDQRTAFLKAYILFLQKKPIPDRLYQIIKQKELMLSVLSFEKFDYLEGLDFIAISKQHFFDHLYRKLVIDPVVEGLPHLFELTSRETGVKVIVSAIKQLRKENNTVALQKVLLADYFIDSNLISPLLAACQNNQLTAVEELIKTTLYLKEKNETDTTLKTMLLDPSMIAFIKMHEQQHEKVIEALLKAAEELRNKDPDDRALQNSVFDKAIPTEETTVPTMSREKKISLNEKADYLTPLLLAQKKEPKASSKKEKTNSHFFEAILPELFLEKILSYCTTTDLYNLRLISKKWRANIFMSPLDREYQLPFISSSLLKIVIKQNSSEFQNTNETELKEKFLVASGSGFLDSNPNAFDEKTLEPFFEWLQRKNMRSSIQYRIIAFSLSALILGGAFTYLLVYIFNKIPKNLTLYLGNSCCADACIVDSCQQISCQTVLTDQAATEQWLSNREDSQNYGWAVSACLQYLPLCMATNNLGTSARMIDGDEQAGLSMACDGYTAKVFSYIGFSILAMAMFGILLYCSCRTASFSDTKIKLEDYNALGDFFKNRIAATKKRSRIEVVTDELSLN